MNNSMIALAAALSFAAFGCKGELQLGTDSPVPKPPISSNNVSIDPFPDIPCEGVACETPMPSATPSISRLTHVQWEKAAQDVLRLTSPPGLASSFLKDPPTTGSFDRMVEELAVQPVLWDNYRAAAETLAERVIADEEALARIMPEGLPDDLGERSRAFVRDLGERAWRRPLEETEVDQIVGVMDDVAEIYGGGATWNQRVELAIRAILQSPNFLYRIELSQGTEGIVNLNGYERATRISFALWNTTPDKTLLDAAKNGELDTVEGVRAHVERMLEDPRAAEVVLDFHGQLMRFDHIDEMVKDPGLFPNFRESTPQALKAELELFLTHTIAQESGTYRDLMTSTVVFADEEVASIYGIEAPTEPFGSTTLDGTQRAGLLTRAAFLASNANQYDPNPIHRGVFVNKHILCNVIPLPPDNFSIPDGVQGNTNRERIENATGECGGACHTPMINPAGYAFENYDALGIWRTQEGEYPVDATGTLPFDNRLNSFGGPIDFIAKIAESPQAHECYVTHWFEYLHGRLPLSTDKPLIARVAQASHSNDVPIKAIIAGLVVNDVFLKRASGGQP